MFKIENFLKHHYANDVIIPANLFSDDVKA